MGVKGKLPSQRPQFSSSSLPAQQPHLLQVKFSQLQPLATSALHQPGYSTLTCQAAKQVFVVSNVAGRETWILFPYRDVNTCWLPKCNVSIKAFRGSRLLPMRHLLWKHRVNLLEQAMRHGQHFHSYMVTLPSAGQQFMVRQGLCVIRRRTVTTIDP